MTDVAPQTTATEVQEVAAPPIPDADKIKRIRTVVVPAPIFLEFDPEHVSTEYLKNIVRDYITRSPVGTFKVIHANFTDPKDPQKICQEMVHGLAGVAASVAVIVKALGHSVKTAELVVATEVPPENRVVL